MMKFFFINVNVNLCDFNVIAKRRFLEKSFVRV